MSSLTQAQMKALQQAETRAILAARNKEAAKAHLLRMQTLLARRPIQENGNRFL